MDAFDALRDALADLPAIGLSHARDAHDDAQRIERALSEAGYLIVPAGSVQEVGRSSVCAGEHVLILDGLSPAEAADAGRILDRHALRRPARTEAA